MKILYSYLRNYWPLLGLALGLAAVNQVFSLLDPYFFRKLIDHFSPKGSDLGAVVRFCARPCPTSGSCWGRPWYRASPKTSMEMLGRLEGMAEK